MLKWVLSKIIGGGLASELREAYVANLNAANNADKIASSIQIAQIEQRLRSQEIGGRWITAVQIAFALPFVIYNCKLVVWDKVLGLGVTDPLSPELAEIQVWVIGFFFGTTIIRGVLR